MVSAPSQIAWGGKMPVPEIPRDDLLEEFIRPATGPGGQHVNRTESAVRLHFYFRRTTAIPEDWKDRLALLAGNQLMGDEIVIVSRETRSLNRNRERARERLHELLLRASVVPKKRKKTKPTRSSVEKRLASKSRRAEIKQNRGKVSY